MIIDIHAHVCAAPELYQWKANQMSARGAHGSAPKKFADDWVRDYPDTKRNARHGYGRHGCPVSVAPAFPTHARRKASKDHGSVGGLESRLHRPAGQGVSQPLSRRVRDPAGPRAPITLGFPEIDRCVKDLGFIGYSSIPIRGKATTARPRSATNTGIRCGKRWCSWTSPGSFIPPAASTGAKIIASTSSPKRASRFSRSSIRTCCRIFPKLKIIVSHGGGSIPYQIGRWQADYVLKGGGTVDEFNRRLGMLYSIPACTRASRSSCCWASPAAST